MAQKRRRQKIERTWKFSYWTTGGKVTREVEDCGTVEEAKEKAREQDIPVEKADVENALYQ
jgi:hypothetical protein